MKREALIREILIKELEYAPSVALRAASTMKNALLKTKNANSDTYLQSYSSLEPNSYTISSSGTITSSQDLFMSNA